MYDPTVTMDYVSAQLSHYDAAPMFCKEMPTLHKTL